MQAVQEAFGITLSSLEPVAHGADEAAQVWRGTDENGAVYAVKLTSGGSSAGLTVPGELHRLGVSGVPAPLLTRDGHRWVDLDGKRLSVVPWVSDRRALDGPMTDEHWRAYGRLLAEVHGAELTPAIEASVPIDDFVNQRLLDTIARLREGIAGVDPLARAAAAEWDMAEPETVVLVDCMTGLGQVLRSQAQRRVLCHADPHLGNLLLQREGGVWLVDWDDAMLAPVERDLMFVFVGVLADPVSDEQRAWFFDGYGEVTVDPARLAYYRCVRALEDFVYFVAEAADPTTGTDQQRARALEFARGIRSPSGLFPLAAASLRAL